MSDYCDCCSTNATHIREHYDTGAITRPDDDPAETLEIFRRCTDNYEGEFPLTVEDVRDYLDELKADREVRA